jgi:hypothetical protein
MTRRQCRRNHFGQYEQVACLRRSPTNNIRGSSAFGQERSFGTGAKCRARLGRLSGSVDCAHVQIENSIDIGGRLMDTDRS